MALEGSSFAGSAPSHLLSLPIPAPLKIKRGPSPFEFTGLGAWEAGVGADVSMFCTTRGSPAVQFLNPEPITPITVVLSSGKYVLGFADSLCH